MLGNGKRYLPTSLQLATQGANRADVYLITKVHQGKGDSLSHFSIYHERKLKKKRRELRREKSPTDFCLLPLSRLLFFAPVPPVFAHFSPAVDNKERE